MVRITKYKKKKKDLLQIQSKKTLKQWLDFSDNKGLQL